MKLVKPMMLCLFMVISAAAIGHVIEFKEISDVKRYENDRSVWDSQPRGDHEQFMSYGEWRDKECAQHTRMDKYMTAFATDGKMDYDSPSDNRAYETVSFDASDRDYL